jgi:hypothetical protein
VLTSEGRDQWRADRLRQSAQHPGPAVRSRGDHYRRRNNGIALRTFREIARWHDRTDGQAGAQ